MLKQENKKQKETHEACSSFRAFAHVACVWDAYLDLFKYITTLHILAKLSLSQNDIPCPNIYICVLYPPHPLPSYVLPSQVLFFLIL